MKGLSETQIKTIIHNANTAYNEAYSKFGNAQLVRDITIEIVKADARARAEA